MRREFLILMIWMICAAPARSIAQGDPVQPTTKPNIFDFGRNYPDTNPPAVPRPSPTQPAADAVPPATVSPQPTAPPKPTIDRSVQRHPVPTASELSAANKQLDDILSADITKASSLERKLLLANKMMQAGVAEQSDFAGKYALLCRARDLAVGGCDLQLCCDLVDTLDASFEVDPIKLKIEGLVAIGKSPKTDRATFLQQAITLSESAEAADEYDLANIAAEQSLATARRLDDKTAVADQTVRSKNLAAAQTAFALVKPSEALLASKPGDPDANLKSGRFRCFIKGDWAVGLPRLAKGSDPRLGALASQDLAGSTDIAALGALADRWWDVGDKETGLARTHVHAHAAEIYDRIYNRLTGLAQARADKRIGESSAESTGHRTVNLLRLFDLGKDAVTGDWTFNDGVLSCDSKLLPVAQFPYQPPEEYDYRIVFNRRGGNNMVSQICSVGSVQFRWLVGGENDTLCGFEMVNGASAEDAKNPTAVRGTDWLQNGRVATSVIKVRRNSIQAFLDGKMIGEMKPPFPRLSNRGDSRLHLNTGLGVCAWDSATDFQIVEVTEISGHGKLLR